jgi:hypothetical protein
VKATAHNQPNPGLTVDRLLTGLRFRGLAYRPDTRQADGLWEAQCPLCSTYGHDGLPLSIRETKGGRVTLSCRNRCPAESIAVNLIAAVEPASIEGRVRRLELLVLGGARSAA